MIVLDSISKKLEINLELITHQILPKKINSNFNMRYIILRQNQVK